ncbi:hypothetical protein IJT93_11790 [bacterium]|nr:hypothetical protein [bacterium]
MRINWKNMWSMDEERTPAEAEDTADFADRLAESIVKRNLGVPALWFMEAMEPVSFLGGQTMLFFSPLAGFMGWNDSYKALADILNSRKRTRSLINKIESAQAQKQEADE